MNTFLWENVNVASPTLTGTPILGGNLNMNNYKITNLSPPINSKDGANKEYIDDLIADVISSGIGSGSGIGPIEEDFDMNNYKIINLMSPTNDNDVTNKKYIDDLISGLDLSGTGGTGGTNEDPTITKDLSMNNFKITNLSLPIDSNDATNKEYVDNLVSDIVISSGGGGGILPILDDLDLNNYKIINLLPPIDPEDGVNKEYADNLFACTDSKKSVRVATTTDLLSNPTVSSIDNITTTDIVITLVGTTFTVDNINITSAENDTRVLVKDQDSNKEHNGIYTTSISSSILTLTRSFDFDNSISVTPSAFFFAEHGLMYGNCGFILVTVDKVITIGTTELVFQKLFTNVSVGNGLSGIDIFNVNVDNTTIEINANTDSLRVKGGSTDGYVLRTIGNGGSDVGWGALDLSNINAISNILPVSNGGVGVSTLTLNKFLEGNGTGGVISTKTIPSGEVIGDTDIQTLINKTLNAPKIDKILDLTDNELLIFESSSPSAVNEVTITNAITNMSPIISSTGDDADIDLLLNPKGVGNVRLSNIAYPNTVGAVNYVMKSNGTDIIFDQINLSTDSVTDTLPLLRGGTNWNLASGSITDELVKLNSAGTAFENSGITPSNLMQMQSNSLLNNVINGFVDILTIDTTSNPGAYTINTIITGCEKNNELVASFTHTASCRSNGSVTEIIQETLDSYVESYTTASISFSESSESFVYQINNGSTNPANWIIESRIIFISST